MKQLVSVFPCFGEEGSLVMLVTRDGSYYIVKNDRRDTPVWSLFKREPLQFIKSSESLNESVITLMDILVGCVESECTEDFLESMSVPFCVKCNSLSSDCTGCGEHTELFFVNKGRVGESIDFFRPKRA